MNELRIEKIRRRVTVALSGRVMLEGDVFLQPTARYRPGPQPPAEVFNEDAPFIPLMTESDELVLLAKDQIARVHFREQPSDKEIEGLGSSPVELVFTDGSTFAGDLRLEVTVTRPRLLDFLNEDHQRFLTLRHAGGICLANRRLIAQVKHTV